MEFDDPDIKSKFELVTLKGADEVENEKIESVGPDLTELKEGDSYPLGIIPTFKPSLLGRQSTY